MSGFNTEPILKGMQGTRPITPEHIFTSDSPLMESWGLCSFTKDNLDFISNYGNFQKIFNKGTQGDEQAKVTYNSIIDGNTEENINITVWRNKGRNGEYIKYEKLSDWQFEDTEGVIGAKGKIYKEKDLKLDDFITEVEEDEENESTPDVRSKIFAHVLIALNTHVNTLDETEELETKDKVRIEFLTDIMSSKERCISWNQTITYYDGVVVSADQPPNQESSTSSDEDEFSGGDSEDEDADELEDGVGSDQATSVRVEYKKKQTDECEIKLYLYSIKDGEIKDNRSVCLKNLNFTNPRSTYDFGEFLKKEDGKLSDLLDSDNPNNDVAAPLDLQYVEYLGRWESGSAQMIAMISEDIPPAETIDIEYIEKNPTEKLLDHETGQQIVYGSAIPIHMQNGNPKQWCATYDKTESLRDNDDFQKSTIRVHNLSAKGFARGELVVLNRIEGLWFPITSVSSSGLGGLKKLEPADPQWEFMYLMTSADFHFQTEDHEKLTPFDYEKGFYRNYYKAFSNDLANSAIETQNKNANLNRYADSFAKFAKVRNEYFQISSFDFVNQNLGGVRSSTLFEQSTDSENVQIDRGHAISNTIYGEDLDGTTYGHGEKLKTYPFFGCVFPEGHSAGAFIDKILNAESTPADYADVKEYGIPYSAKGYSLMSEVYYGGTKEQLAVDNDVQAVQAGETKQTLGLLSNLADSNFKHVPADIATNAGPNGRWGRPIEWVGYFNLLDTDIYSNNPKEHTSCDTFLSKIRTEDGKSTVPLRGSFLYVKGSGEDTPADGYDNYWYDIQPLNHYSIQFRPLSRELYASFEAYDEINKKYDFAGKGLDTEGFTARGDVSNRVYQAIKGYRGPLSKTSWHRNLVHLANKNLNAPTSLIGNYGLKYSSDLVYNTPFGSDNRLFNLPSNVDGTDDGYPFKHWDSDWMKVNNVMRPGGAIGIIGAVKTVRSRDTIAFSTDNIIGLGDHLVVTTPLEYGSTMKNGDIDDQLTTALYARVYQHHPRHLTWYDPRFMVVHHFSAGDGRTGKDRNHVKFKLEQDDPDVLFEDGIDRFKTQSNSMFEYYATHENGVVFEDELEDFDFSASNKNYDPAASGYFLIDKVEYNVDFRVPTDWDKNNIPVGNSTPKNRVFSDSTENLTAKAEQAQYRRADSCVEKLRNVDHWNVNNNRRSKLLPYSYRFKTIGISKSKGVQFNPINGIVDLFSYNTAVVNKGSGYKVGDKFEVIGGVGFGTVYTVKATDADGAITDIAILEDDETGMRYEPQDFIALYKEDDGTDPLGYKFVENDMLWDDENTPSSSLSLQPISDTDVTGTGFEAYVFYGEVVLTTELTDIKPLEALDSTGPIKLTPNIPRNDTNRNQDQIITPVGNSYQILNPHFDHKYDIFLRYHNDISHVTMNDLNPPNASEQQVTLTVGVNLGQAPTSSPSDQLGMSFDASDNAAGSLLGGLGGDPFSNFDEDSAADGAGSFLGFGGGVGGNSSFR